MKLRSFTDNFVGKVNSFLEAVEDKYYRLIPYENRPRQLKDRLRCWITRPHTTIKPRYLPHTWEDKDAILLHVMFEVFSRFIEDECSPGNIDWVSSHYDITIGTKTVNVREEMQELYDWWHKDYIPNYYKCGLANNIWENMPEPISWMAPIKENNAIYYRYDLKFKNKNDKKLYHEGMSLLTNIDTEYTEAANEMTLRLINIQSYMWT